MIMIITIIAITAFTDDLMAMYEGEEEPPSSPGTHCSWSSRPRSCPPCGSSRRSPCKSPWKCFLHICETFIAFSSNFARSRHLARQVGQHKLQLLSGDAPLVILAEHPERLLQLVFRVSVTELLVHHQTELWEFEEAWTVHVHLIGGNFVICWYCIQRFEMPYPFPLCLSIFWVFVFQW